MVLDDLRYAWRAVRARPAFALTVVSLMALTIGANAAIFSLIDTVLLSALSFRDPSRLVVVNGTRGDDQQEPFSIPDYVDVERQTRAFEALVPAIQWSANLTGGDAERLQGMKTTAAFFEMLGVPMALGRPIAGDDVAGRRRVVVISHGLWVRRFGAVVATIGQAVVLNGDRYAIVGILPDRFVTPVRDVDVIVPFVREEDPRREVRDARFMRLVGRLRPNVTLSQAQADLSSIVAGLRTAYPSTNAAIAGARVEEWHRTLVSKARPALLLLQGVAIFVLLVACANLANLFLVSAIRREREFAVRAALGGARLRLARQVLLEGAIIATAGAASGLLLDLWTRRSLVALAPADWPALGAGVGVDGRVLMFTAGATILATVACSSLPAWRVALADPSDVLRGASRDDAASTGRVARRALVSIEVALATALMLTTVLLSESFAKLQRVDPGFHRDHLLTVRLSLPRDRYSRRAHVQEFIDVLRPRLLALPGVSHVAAVNVVPLNNYLATSDVWRADRPAPAPDAVPEAHYRMITPGYLATFGVPLIAGRAVDDHDTESSGSVVLVSRRLSQRLWGNESALNKEIVMTDSPVERRATVVGVVGDVKHLGLETDATADVYVPIRQVPEFTIQWLTNNMYWGLRTSVEPNALREAVRREIQLVDRDVPASSMKTMDEVLEATIAPRRTNLWLVRVFAGAALLLAAAGVYAVAAFGVASRRRELAIRLALGAGYAGNMRSMLEDLVRPAIVGVVGGGIVLGLGTPFLRAVLFGVDGTRPLTFLAVMIGMLTLVSLAAILGSARLRGIDPIVALRD